MQTIDQILSLIGQHGYLIVFLGVMAESAGVPFPGETVLLAAGVMAQRGHIDLGDAIAFGVLGAVIGDQIGYWVGREDGRPFVLRWGRYVFITPERLSRARATCSPGGRWAARVGLDVPDGGGGLPEAALFRHRPSATDPDGVAFDRLELGDDRR